MIVTQDLQKIILKKFRESMTMRNERLVLRYYKPNEHLYPVMFACRLLLLFYPFMSESGHFSKDRTYSGKLQEPTVCHI